MESSLVSRNVRVGARRTSVRLEPELWEALDDICIREDRSLHQLCTALGRAPGDGGFTSRLRVFILVYFRELAERLETSPVRIENEAEDPRRAA